MPHNNSATNVSYDGRALLIDGERRLLAAGSIHYARSEPEQWQPILKTAKAGGIDVITTYVFWNLHEVHDAKTGTIAYVSPYLVRALFVPLCIAATGEHAANSPRCVPTGQDFASGRRNIRGFLQAAQEAGLH
jgi:hypothetical protein